MRLAVGFSKPNKFKIGAWLISKWINKPYDHAFVAFYYDDSKAAVFEAAQGNVHFKSLVNFINENEIVKLYPIDIAKKEHIEFFDECMNLSCEPYSIKELVNILFYDICYKLGKKITVPDCKGYICSELVGKLLIDKMNITFDKPKQLLSPADIEDKLQELHIKATNG